MKQSYSDVIFFLFFPRIEENLFKKMNSIPELEYSLNLAQYMRSVAFVHEKCIPLSIVLSFIGIINALIYVSG